MDMFEIELDENMLSIPTLDSKASNGFPFSSESSEKQSVRVFNPELLTPLEYLKSVAKEYKLEDSNDAFFVCNLSEVVKQWTRWRNLVPRVKPYYAIKCNDDAAVLRTLAELGAGFDCASQYEVNRVLSLGVGSERIIYANPCKQLSMIRFARSKNVELMTFDNTDELRKIKSLHPHAKLVLRILPPAVHVKCVLGIKFGAHESQVEPLIRAAKELELELVGVSFHVGSGCHEARGYSLAVQAAKRTWTIMERYGYRPYLLDIGGGFPGSEQQDWEPSTGAGRASALIHEEENVASTYITFDEIAATLNIALDEYFPPDASGRLQIISEPGRYFVEKAYSLCVSVIARRDLRATKSVTSTQDSEEREKEQGDAEADKEKCKAKKTQIEVTYYVNDGVYGSFNCLFFDQAVIEPHFVDQLQESTPLAERKKSILYGPTCDGLDTLLRNYPLPELHLGDWLYFHCMGAYSLTASSEFNGMPRPRMHYLLTEADREIFARFEDGRTRTTSSNSNDSEGCVPDMVCISQQMKEQFRRRTRSRLSSSADTFFDCDGSLGEQEHGSRSHELSTSSTHSSLSERDSEGGDFEPECTLASSN